MATLTHQQIEQKKQLLAEKMKEIKALHDELVQAGALPLDENDLDGVAGGAHPPKIHNPMFDEPLKPTIPKETGSSLPSDRSPF